MQFALLARRWRRHIDAELTKLGLTSASWIPMFHLQETGGGITQKDLALRVGVDGSSLVRVLDLLARDGLIERRRDESDGRARLIHLTEHGCERVAEVRRHLLAAEEDLLADLSDADIARMLGDFDAMNTRLDLLENPQSRATPDDTP